MGLDPGTPGSGPGLKAGAKLLSHPEIPSHPILLKDEEHGQRGLPSLNDVTQGLAKNLFYV